VNPPAIPDRLIITADDFGLDRSSNEAIVEALVRGWVTHASLLVNLGYADDAAILARGASVNDRIGVHLNFSEGEPLTPALRNCEAFCGQGRFLPVEEFPRYKTLTAEQRTLVAAEIRAQIAAASSRGLAVSHLDSHNDVHIAPSIARIVTEIAGELRIPRVRISRNCGLRQGIVRRVHHRTYNAWLWRRGLRRVRYYGSVDDMIWLGRRGSLDKETTVEIMTHPRQGPSGEILDVPSMEPLGNRLKRLRPYLPVTA
jgi:chitin disaccharide deacetylase